MDIILNLTNGNQLGVNRDGIEAVVVTKDVEGIEWAQLLFKNERCKTKQGMYPSYKISDARFPLDMKRLNKQDGYIICNDDCILCVENIGNYSWITFNCGEKYKVLNIKQM